MVPKGPVQPGKKSSDPSVALQLEPLINLATGSGWEEGLG